MPGKLAVAPPTITVANQSVDRYIDLLEACQRSHSRVNRDKKEEQDKSLILHVSKGDGCGRRGEGRGISRSSKILKETAIGERYI